VLRFLNIIFIVLGLCSVGTAYALKRGIFPPDTPEKYRSECAGCHIAYPPDLLTSSSWRKIMNGLDRHFGSNAELDDSSRQQIEDYLVHHSGHFLGLKKEGSDIRITQTLWFNRMHGKSKKHFDNPNIVAGSNCGACHLNAADGRFDENKIPANAEWNGLPITKNVTK